MLTFTIKFYENELYERKKFNYPPYNKLIKIEFKNRIYLLGKIEANNFYKKINSIINKKNILGPIKSGIDKTNIYIKINRDIKKIEKIKKFISTIIEKFNNKTVVSIDVDPYN